MARSALTVQQPGQAGQTPSFAAVDQANGNSFPWPGVSVLVEVKNAGGGSCTVTLRGNGAKLGGLALTDQTYTVPATTGDKMFAIVDPAGVLQSDGAVYLDFSTGSSVTVQVTRLE